MKRLISLILLLLFSAQTSFSATFPVCANGYVLALITNNPYDKQVIAFPQQYPTASDPSNGTAFFTCVPSNTLTVLYNNNTMGNDYAAGKYPSLLMICPYGNAARCDGGTMSWTHSAVNGPCLINGSAGVYLAATDGGDIPFKNSYYCTSNTQALQSKK